MNEDYNNETSINSLVDQYLTTRDAATKSKLLESFDPYFNKYVYLLCSSSPVDINNKDTITFLRLFMNDEDRSSPSNISIASKRTLGFLRGVFSDCEPQDIYDEMVCIFLEQLYRYHPMVTTGKHIKERISFTHFLQVNTRYKVKNIALQRARDALYGTHNIEYHDEINGIPTIDPWNSNYNRIDYEWVWGDTSGDIFNQLDEYERYLIFLKYESPKGKPLSDYDLAKLTGQDRMYIRRKMLTIKDKIKHMVEVG
jgi:hypothetical protein